MQYVICLRNQLIAGFDGIYQLSLPSIVDRWAGSISINVCIQPRNWHAVWNQWLKKKKKKIPSRPRLFSSRLCTLVWPQCWLGPCVNYKVKQVLSLLAYSLGEVVRKDKTGLRLADMESAETAFGIYTYVCVCVCTVMHFHGNVYVDEKASKHILGVPIWLWVRCCMRTTLDNRCKPRKRLCERVKGPVWRI